MERLRRRFPHAVVARVRPAGRRRARRATPTRAPARARRRRAGAALRRRRRAAATPTTTSWRCCATRSRPAGSRSWRRRRLAADDAPAPPRGCPPSRRSPAREAGRLRRARRGRAVPAARRHRRRQDDAARRGVLRALRRGPGRARARRAAALRPRRARRAHRGRAGGHAARAGACGSTARPTQERPKLRGDGDDRAGTPCTVVEHRAGDGEWTVLATRHDEATPRARRDLLGHVARAVLPGRAAAAGRVRDASCAPTATSARRLLRRLFDVDRFARRRALAERPPQGAGAALRRAHGRRARAVVARGRRSPTPSRRSAGTADPGSVAPWLEGGVVVAEAGRGHRGRRRRARRGAPHAPADDGARRGDARSRRARPRPRGGREQLATWEASRAGARRGRGPSSPPRGARRRRSARRARCTRASTRPPRPGSDRG